ncbi:MAG: hypothetical protein AAF567_24290 [Actinomycetota bacterium]
MAATMTQARRTFEVTYDVWWTSSRKGSSRNTVELTIATGGGDSLEELLCGAALDFENGFADDAGYPYEVFLVEFEEVD